MANISGPNPNVSINSQLIARGDVAIPGLDKLPAAELKALKDGLGKFDQFAGELSKNPVFGAIANNEAMKFLRDLAKTVSTGAAAESAPASAERVFKGMCGGGGGGGDYAPPPPQPTPPPVCDLPPPPPPVVETPPPPVVAQPEPTPPPVVAQPEPTPPPVVAQPEPTPTVTPPAVPETPPAVTVTPPTTKPDPVVSKTPVALGTGAALGAGSVVPSSGTAAAAGTAGTAAAAGTGAAAGAGDTAAMAKAFGDKFAALMKTNPMAAMQALAALGSALGAAGFNPLQLNTAAAASSTPAASATASAAGTGASAATSAPTTAAKASTAGSGSAELNALTSTDTKGMMFEDKVAAMMVEMVKKMQEDIEKRLTNIKDKADAAAKKKDDKGGESRNIEFEMLKNDMQKLSQMQQAFSGVLNAMNESAMNAVKSIR